MPPRISLALAIHNHQPVGNFGWVFAEVFEKAYEPMVDDLERHPSVRLSLHYTGPLLEWLRRERPEFLERLRALVERGQVELLGGAYYEPVLVSLPERDRLGQLRRMADEVEALAGTRPRGAWLAERVWEPSLPSTLAEAGYRWTIVDDNHFKAAAISNEALWGAYTTEDQGRLLNVFGTEQGLRYLIPFRDVEDVIDHLRAHATDDGKRLGMMGDDGEKFGAWPTTFEHCWGSRQWMERFFRALEDNAEWLTTTTPSAWLDREAPIGRVYLPTASYAEMGEWALPPTESRLYSQFLHEVRDAGRPEADWLRGGFWRNFQVKYREINDLHKQMLRTSEKVAAMPAGLEKDRALDHLYRGQSNDCYWHGLFGGIYIGHMRLATYEHLIAAEDLADSAARAEGAAPDGGRLRDVDLDGIDEVLFTAPGASVTIKLDEGAGIGSWDIRAARHALLSIMRRRPEAYHARLVEHDRSVAARLEREAAGDGASGPAGLDDAPASIHDIVAVKEEGLSSRLRYDAYERRSGLVRFLHPTTTVDDLIAARPVELGDFVSGAFELTQLVDDCAVAERDGHVVVDDDARRVHVSKTVSLIGGRLDPGLVLEVRVDNRSEATIDARLAVEWNVMALGGGGNPAAYYLVDGVRSAHDAPGNASGGVPIRSGNEYVGVALESSASPAAEAWWYPIETISNSEAGFERVYQGSCLLFSWLLSLAPGAEMTVRVDHRVTVDRDRAEEEAAEAAAVG